MSEEKPPRTSRKLRWVVGILLSLAVLYISSYLVLSRMWRSDLEAALGPNRLSRVTCYVPVSVLFTEKGYGLHCMLCGFYDPISTVDRSFGGPVPIAITFGIGQKKHQNVSDP